MTTLKWDTCHLTGGWPRTGPGASFLSMTGAWFPWLPCNADLLLLLPPLLLLLQMTDALIQFLLLNLTPVMKLGLLCFSHYLFIKDMTRKWGCHGDGATKSPSCMQGCIVYSFAKTAVFNRKRRLPPTPTHPPPSPPHHPTLSCSFIIFPFFYGSNNDLMQIAHSSVVLFVNAERFH